jgi:hypothetical protein
MSGHKNEALALRWRVGLLLTAVAGTIMANRRGLGWWFAFPDGLLRLIPAGYLIEEGSFLLWGIYFALVARMLYVKSRRPFFVSFAVLCGLLIVNTLGCHRYFPERGPYYP